MKKSKPITHLFRGKRYSVRCGRYKKMRGWCDDPAETEKVINIPYRGESLDDLSTIIHESIHACLWDTSEESVEETGESIAKLLWKLGWRRDKIRKK